CQQRLCAATPNRGARPHNIQSLPILDDYAGQVGFFSSTLRGQLLEQTIQLTVNAFGAGINPLQLEYLSISLLNHDRLSGSKSFLGRSVPQLPSGNALFCHSANNIRLTWGLSSDTVPLLWSLALLLAGVAID